MTPETVTFRALTDAAAAAIGRAIAGLEKDAARDRELREAEHRARLAELETRTAAVAQLERQVAERLALLKDGEPGTPGTDGRDGKDGVPGTHGIDGKDGIDGRDGEPGEPGRDGIDGKDGQIGLPGEPGRDGIDGQNGKDGIDGANGIDGVPGRDGLDGKDGRDGVDGKDGRDGERGPEGPIGKLPIVRAWSDGVHYEGDVVTFDGRTYQALRDTGKEPGHEDWRCLVERGVDGCDGRSFNIRGTWAEDEIYSALDVVAVNGASFVARSDQPGACPGDGWQMIAAQGKRGHPGERGLPGKDGERGPAGMPVVAAMVDEDGVLTLTNGDGTTVVCDFYPVLTRLAK